MLHQRDTTLRPRAPLQPSLLSSTTLVSCHSSGAVALDALGFRSSLQQRARTVAKQERLRSLPELRAPPLKRAR